MNENIELKKFNTNDLKESDSEEYHEIGQEVISETVFQSTPPVSLHHEYNFFTQFDIKNIKNVPKTKKIEKKENFKDLMEVIHSEISTKPLIIPNNIITVDYTDEVLSYLENNSRMQQILHGGYKNTDIEHGYNRKKLVNICPNFPRVLEGNASNKTNLYVQYVEPSLFSDNVSEYLEYESQQNPKFFDVILRNIKFKHHHEFSLEKFLSVKLLELYDQYEITKKSIIDLSRNVELNKRTRNNLKEQLLQINQKKKNDVRFDENVLKYTKLMLEYKEKYLDMLKLEKEIIHKMMSLWADIEMIREKSGHVMTNYTLEIEDTEIDDNEFHEQWMQIFKNEYSDMIIKLEFEFINKYLEYKMFKRSEFTETDNGKNKIVKPKLKIDYDNLTIEVEKIVSTIFSKNKIQVFLKRDKAVTVSRSRKAFTHNYYFKIYVNEVFVGESEAYVSKAGQWDVDFDECLSIEILPQNNSLNIILFENDIDVSFLKINLSGIKKNTNESNFTSQDFIYNNTVVEPNSKRIGSGYDIKEICAKNKARLKSSNLFKGKLLTTCEVNMKLGWNEKLSDNQHESVKSCMNIGRQIQRSLHSKDAPNMEVLLEIVNYLYGYCIESNPKIMIKIKHICQNTLKTSDFFYFTGNDSDFIRYKLLYLRNNGGFADIQNKTIPLYTSQLSTEQLDSLQKIEKDADYLDIKSYSKMNTVELQRFIGVKFVEKLNKKLMKNVNEFLLRKTYKDVVKDFGDLSFRAIISNRADLSFSAGLNVTNRRVIKECLSKEQDIQITVLKALNLFNRRRSATILTTEENEDDNIAGFKVHALRPFVRINYRGVTGQTATAIGCHPTWNHTVKVKTRLEPLSSIVINVFDECKDDASDLYSDDQSTQSTVYYRKSNKWLGTLKVPLQTVLNYGNIRGTFKIATPILTFGYENLSSKESRSLIPEVTQIVKKEMPLLVLQISTSISHLGGYQNYYQPVPNNPQDDSMIRHLNEFVTEYLNEFPTRNIFLIFIDSSGKNKCVSEFLQPIPLPNYECFPINPKKAESALSKSSGLSKSSSSKSSRKKSSITGVESMSSGFESHKSNGNLFAKNMEGAVRYVSLIPTYEVTESYVVTLLGVELLKVLYGSSLDHTILLASYFLHLRIKCWIIIGFGILRGLSSYVLIKHYNNKVVTEESKDLVKNKGFLNKNDGPTWYIYDAVSGERFEFREIGCPLKTVSYVFNSENIWVNVQASQDCDSVFLDFDKSSDWQVVFNKPLFATRALVSISLYSKPGEIESLRSNLENKIKSKFQKWRSHVKTIWNRYCSGLLKEMLPYYEYWSFNSTEIRPSFGHRLKQLMATYKIFGFPLNMSYLNTKQIISSVKSTAIHVNEDPNVEFGLSVEVYAYPNNVLSVWVFLVSITRM